jgi:hypothetical protein
MRIVATLLLAFALLTAIAATRPPEYDEAYSLFLTAGDARPAWPGGIFAAGSVRPLYTGQASLSQISRNLKQLDVHPPLSFWTLEYWRRLAGGGWFAARMLSVIWALGALALVAWIAAATAIPILPALGFTLLSYGFAYTGIVARGFALAQFLNLAGVALTLLALRRRQPAIALAAGLAFGAASFSNYLAIFTALAATAWLAVSRRHDGGPGSNDASFGVTGAAYLVLGLSPFLLTDFTFFTHQLHSRVGQFQPFRLLPSCLLLLKDSAGAWGGALPLYAGSAGPLVALLELSVIAVALAAIWLQRHGTFTSLFALTTAATPAGLLTLGCLFHNTPIEVRYLAFSLPFFALLLAGAAGPRLRSALLVLQAAGIAGLALAPATMQPQAAAAAQAVSAGGLILLPFGNDGVGIPGPFIASLPDNARLQLMRSDSGDDFPLNEPAMVLITLRIDAASSARTAARLSYLQTHPCLHITRQTPLITAISNRCAAQNDQHGK